MSSMYPFGGAVARSCMRCGAQLGSKESQCSRCGTYNPLPQGQQLGMPQQGASGQGWGQAPQFPQAGNNAGWPGATGPSNSGWDANGQAGGGWPQQNNLFGGQNSPQQNNLFGGQNSPQQNIFPPNNGFGGQNQSSFNNSFSAFPQNPNQSSSNTFFNATQQQNGFGASSFNATQQQEGFGASSWQSMNDRPKPAWMKGQDNESDGKKKGKNKAAMAVIVVVVIALIGGGLFAAYKGFRSSNNQPAANNTPAIVTPTGTPLFRETFQNNNAGWDTNTPTGAKLTFANNGKLLMESDNNTVYQELLPGGKTYGDFQLEMDAGLTSGDPNNGYGVYFRGASTQNDVLGLYYRFEIYGDGSFVVWKGIQKADGSLESDNLTPANAGANKNINPKGQMNHLTIIAKGSKLEFYVNGSAVAAFSDDSYKSGTIALFVSNVPKLPAGAQATFSNLAIFPTQ